MEVFVEMHCHILPGVDDGADDMDEAVELLRLEYEQGVRQIILTPHYREGYFETSRDQIRQVYQELCKAAVKAGLQMELYLGCELHRSSDILERLERDTAYCMADTRYVLLEFSEIDTFQMIRSYTSGLINYGYRPIVAHAERCKALSEEKIKELIELGAYIQINAESILGKSGWRTKNFCRRLLKDGNVHFVGSDSHHVKYRSPCLGLCAAYMKKKLGEEETRRLLRENPEKLLRNDYIT